MKILFYDLETTGFSSKTDEIINIAAIVYNEDTDQVEDMFNEFIKPSSPIPYTITQITGITNDMVAHSYGEGVVLKEFMDWVKKQHCQKHAGHNIHHFDDRWIADKCKEYTINNEFPRDSIDTLDTAKEAFNNGLLDGYNYTTARGNISFKLENLMDYFNLGTQEHQALSDVQFNIMVYSRIHKMLGDKSYGF